MQLIFYLKKTLNLILLLAILAVLVSRSGIPSTDRIEKVRSYTRSIEFDYIAWILDAMLEKATSNALGAHRFLPAGKQSRLVQEYMDLTRQQGDLVVQITRIYADPDVEDSQELSETLRAKLADIAARLKQITPMAESILQAQISEVVADLGLTVGGQPVPPIWYHSTPVPMALIVSPRYAIRQDANISILAEMNVDQMEKLEIQVSQDLNVSSLVVPIGGVGIYPTMVMRTSDLSWLTEVISHEWIHNYLTLRPLGINYEISPEMRTMNETAASLAGKEIGREVIRRYYPEMLPKEAALVPQANTTPVEAPRFSYNSEMQRIRVQADDLLAKGKIAEAEKFMDDSRRTFLENGYLVRKINQAYFAFYGAYADEPGGGAAGRDPVGPAVVELRRRSTSLADFLQRIAWMTSFEDLQKVIQ